MPNRIEVEVNKALASFPYFILKNEIKTGDIYISNGHFEKIAEHIPTSEDIICIRKSCYKSKRIM